MSRASSEGREQAHERDDAALVRAHLDGDEFAFEALYKRHAHFVATVLWRAWGARVELEDAVQETFIEAHRQLPELRDAGALRGWLARIALGTSATALRRASRRRGLLALYAQNVARRGDLRSGDEAFALSEQIERLPEPERRAWVLRRVVGLSLGEAAEACACSLATVKRRITRADGRLAEEEIDA